MKHSRRTRAGISRRRVIVLFTAALIALAALLAGVNALGTWLEQRQYPETRQVSSEGFGQLPRVQYQGQTYVRRPEVATILLIGVDREADAQPQGYRNGGQGDFLLLLAIDHKNRQVSQLHLERDAITDVPVVGVLGNDAGTRRMQLCLAHAYGVTEADRCRHTAQAVANLLGGYAADMVCSMRLDAVGALNRALGGVTVTIPEDLSVVDSAMLPGAVLTLTDAQAEILVRARMNVGDGTNRARMRRQRVFMAAALDQLRRLVQADAEAAGRLFDTLAQNGGYSTVQRGRIVNEAAGMAAYTVLPLETLPGEYGEGADGFTEFYVDQEAAAQWLLRTLYERTASQPS